MLSRIIKKGSKDVTVKGAGMLLQAVGADVRGKWGREGGVI